MQLLGCAIIISNKTQQISQNIAEGGGLYVKL